MTGNNLYSTLQIHTQIKAKPVQVVPFVELAVAEQRFVEILKLKEEELKSQTHLALLPPLIGLLQLYRIWSEDAPAVSKQKGTDIATRVLAIFEAHQVDALGALNECALFFFRFAEYQE